MKRLLKLTYNNLNLNIQLSDGIFNRSLSHGRNIFDRRYAHVDNAAEEGKQLSGGLKSEKHLAEVVKDSDREAAEMRKPRNTSVESKIIGPFVHNLREKKPVNRKVFTFKCIQSTHGVTHRIQESKVYNNIYPDAPTDSGLVYTFLLHSTVDV